MGKVLRVVVLGLVLLLTSCMSTQNFSEIVKNELGDFPNKSQKQPVDNVVLKTDQLHYSDSVLIVKKKKYYCIPAIVYWQQVNVIDCEVNNKYFVNLFSDRLKDAANEFQLTKHLGSRKLEISIESVPSSFRYSDRFYGVFTLICFSIYSEHIYPQNRMLKLTYRIYDGKELTKTGQYTAEVIGPMKNNFDTHSEFIQGYVTNLKSNFEYHSEKAMLRILDELY